MTETSGSGPDTPSLEPAVEPAPGPADDGANVGRRKFFRELAGEVFHGAAGVVGVAQALQRASA